MLSHHLSQNRINKPGVPHNVHVRPKRKQISPFFVLSFFLTNRSSRPALVYIRANLYLSLSLSHVYLTKSANEDNHFSSLQEINVTNLNKNSIDVKKNMRCSIIIKKPTQTEIEHDDECLKKLLIYLSSLFIIIVTYP